VYSDQKTGELAILNDPHLKVEQIGRRLADSPTCMDFLDNNHILVLEKGTGAVRLISDGILQERPVLKVSVNSTSERGLLGIAISKNDFDNKTLNKTSKPISVTNKSNIKVFLYFTESIEGKPPRNTVYGYQWNGTKLINPTLILDLPAIPGSIHNGGKLIIGPDHYLYAVIGDVQHTGLLQNFNNRSGPDNTSVIFKVNPTNGLPAKNNPLLFDNKSGLMNKYYAYGIRNSFGLAFDPVSGNLWETENGPDMYDEINLVKPGFNSGWKKIMGPILRTPGSYQDLVNLPGSKYSDPVFSWRKPVAVTGLDFMKSSKLGEKYTDNLFVGDFNNGNLYYFKVNEGRTGLNFDENQTGLSDLVADNSMELSKIIFGTGFGSITDVKSGPDGFLYVLDFDKDRIFRIRPVG
jgi:glucose/arabinose dehydrogenase